MTLTIIKNGARDFDHQTEFANMTFSNYSMVLNNTLQNVIIMRPNGSSFPNDAVGIVDVRFQDNTDAGTIETFATTELLKARLIAVDYNGLVEPSGGGGGAVDSVFTRTGNVTAQSGDYNTGQVTEVTDKKYVTDANLTKINEIDQAVSSAEKSTWNAKQSALTFDSSPTNASTNPVTSGGVFTALATKQDTLTETNFGAFTNSLTTQDAIDDADVFNYRDNSDSGKQKKTLWSNIKAVLKAYFDGFYSTKTRIFLTSDLANSTVADIDVTGFTFTLGAGESCDFRVCLPFTGAATSTGINIGVKVVTAIGADGVVLGNTYTKTRLSTSTVGNTINVVDQSANATVSYSALTGVSTAGVTNAGEVDGTLENLATNTSATIQIIFASEVAGSAITIKRGASMVIEK